MAEKGVDVVISLEAKDVDDRSRGLAFSRILSVESVDSFSRVSETSVDEEPGVGFDLRGESLGALCMASSTGQSESDIGVSPGVLALDELGCKLEQPLRGLVFGGNLSVVPAVLMAVDNICEQVGSGISRTSYQGEDEKENPQSPRTHGVRILTCQPVVPRAPMKPARLSFLNQRPGSSVVRRRLHFDGL